MVKRLLMVVSLMVATMPFILDARADQNSLQTLEQTAVVSQELPDAEHSDSRCKNRQDYCGACNTRRLLDTL